MLTEILINIILIQVAFNLIPINAILIKKMLS